MMRVSVMPDDAYAALHGKRLVIFGCGYVGSAVATRALERGAHVTALTRNAVKAAELRLAGIEVVEAQLADRGWHGRLAAGADFVLNSVSSGGGGVEQYRTSYVEGMKSIAAWAAREPVGTVVYTSSTSVYPQGNGAVVDEESSTDGARETGQILLEAEMLLRGAGQDAWARWFVLRLAGIYGPGRHGLLDQLRAGAVEIAGRGEHRLNLIHRDDAASAVLATFAAPVAVANEVFNLCDDFPGPRHAVVHWLANKLVVTTPTFNGGSSARKRGETPDRVISNRKIQQLLGWKPNYPDFRAGYESILLPS